MDKLHTIRIKCNAVSYRQGFIEVIPNIHDGCVNLETWDLHGDVDISSMDWMDERLRDEDFHSNCEIELTKSQAIVLARALLNAAAEVLEPT